MQQNGPNGFSRLVEPPRRLPDGKNCWMGPVSPDLMLETIKFLRQGTISRSHCCLEVLQGECAKFDTKLAQPMVVGTTEV